MIEPRLSVLRAQPTCKMDAPDLRGHWAAGRAGIYIARAAGLALLFAPVARGGVNVTCTSSCSAEAQAAVGDGDQAAVCALTDEDWSCINIEGCPFTSTLNSDLIALHCHCDTGALFENSST